MNGLQNYRPTSSTGQELLESMMRNKLQNTNPTDALNDMFRLVMANNRADSGGGMRRSTSALNLQEKNGMFAGGFLSLLGNPDLQGLAVRLSSANKGG